MGSINSTEPKLIRRYTLLNCVHGCAASRDVVQFGERMRRTSAVGDLEACWRGGSEWPYRPLAFVLPRVRHHFNPHAVRIVEERVADRAGLPWT